ncbi:transglycosylase SLT domain-containing protein [Vreelandella aquamarina]
MGFIPWFRSNNILPTYGFYRLLALVSTLFLAPPAVGQFISDADMRSALSDARAQRWENINTQATGQHILGGYIEYHQLKGRLPDLAPERVKEYMDRHSDAPLADWLQGQAIDAYGKARQWADIRVIATQPPANTERQCYFYTAWLDITPQQAYDGGKELWLTGRSQPDACDSLFDSLRSRGVIDQQAIWERKMLAWEADERALVNYLGSLLDNRWQAAIQRVESTTGTGSLYDAPSCLGPECAATPTFYQAAMQRLTQEDTQGALAVWSSLADRLSLPPKTQQTIEEELAFYALLREIPGSYAWVDRTLPTLESERVLELRVRRALQANDWAAVQQWIASMSDGQRNDSRWQYWLGRASEQQGNQQAAEAHFFQAAGQRDFFGFAAAERINQPLPLNIETYTANPDDRQRIANMPAVQRTEALMRIGEEGLASSEWLNAARHAPEQTARAMAEYADSRGWYALLVQTTIAAQLWDALAWRFPEAYREQFMHWGRMTDVDPYLLMAIARRESAYNPAALSPAGARGLMQLMPGTATQLSRELGIADPGPYGVLDPELNIRLGSTYIRDKLERYRGNRLAAAAAYNAGPGRVDRWLREEGINEFDLFVERIPFRETRQYVQAVLTYRAIYAALNQDGSTQGISLLNPHEQSVRYDASLLNRP